jgi:hypothetical protein
MGGTVTVTDGVRGVEVCDSTSFVFDFNETSTDETEDKLEFTPDVDDEYDDNEFGDKEVCCDAIGRVGDDNKGFDNDGGALSLS